MKNYNAYTKIGNEIVSISQSSSTSADVTKAYVDEQLGTKADKTELVDYAKTTEVTKTVTDEIAKVVADAPSSFDTLKEIADWIDTHEDSASAMNTAIQKNTKNITSLSQKIDAKASIKDTNSTATTTYSSNKIDELLQNKVDVLGDISETTVTFEEPTERAKPATGEKLKLMMGKIAKLFTDLKAIAFSGSYNDLTDKPIIPKLAKSLDIEKEGLALDATQGKILNDKLGSEPLETTMQNLSGAVNELNSTNNLQSNRLDALDTELSSTKNNIDDINNKLGTQVIYKLDGTTLNITLKE